MTKWLRSGLAQNIAYCLVWFKIQLSRIFSKLQLHLIKRSQWQLHSRKILQLITKLTRKKTLDNHKKTLEEMKKTLDLVKKH